MKIRHGLLAEKDYRSNDNTDEEDIDDPLALSLPALSPSDHYISSYHTEQSNTWRHNSQNQAEGHTEFISDHQSSSTNVKNERKTSHYCSSQNIPRTFVMNDKLISSPYISSSISDVNVQEDTHEDAHTRGQLMQEISRVIDDLDPYASARALSRSSRTSNVAISNAQQPTDCNYISSNGTSNWVCTGPNYNRVANPSVNSFYTGTNQSAGVGSVYEYNNATDGNNYPVKISSLNSTSPTLPIVTTPSRDPHDNYIVPTSALDLSPSQGTQSSGNSTHKTHRSPCTEDNGIINRLHGNHIEKAEETPRYIIKAKLHDDGKTYQHLYREDGKTNKLVEIKELEENLTSLVPSGKDDKLIVNKEHKETETFLALSDVSRKNQAYENWLKTLLINEVDLKQSREQKLGEEFLGDISEDTSYHSSRDLPTSSDVGQFRGCTVNCSKSPGPPAAHLQPSLLHHLDLPPHQLEGEAALDMVIHETGKHNHKRKDDSSLSRKLFIPESSHTSGTHNEKVICASSNRESKETSYIIGTCDVGTNRNGPESYEINEKSVLSQQQHISMREGSNLEDAFKCNECGASFSKMTNLKSHMKKHTSKKLYSCNKCPSVLTAAGSLVIHKRLHSGYKPFKCNICQQAFSGAGLLATHKRKHTGEKPYTCTKCGMSFRLLSTLKSHMRRHTGEKPFSCDLCHTSFTQRAALKRHQRTHSDFKPWECQQCGLTFKEKENLRKHMALHKLKSHHTCEVCGEGFTNAKKLEKHKISHIGGERPYKCPKCDSRFTTAKYLTQHQKRVHERKGSISCEECHATFKRKETYTAHVKIHVKIHVDDKSFSCGECGAAFTQRGTLTKHLRVHYGMNNSNELQCKQCGLKYADKNTLEKHLKTHSTVKMPDNIDTFYCDSCSNTYSCEEDLGLHSSLCHSSSKLNENSIDESNNVDNYKEISNKKYVCEECHQTFFRKHQLKAHHRYCFYRIPSLKTHLSPPVPQPQPTIEGRSTGNSSIYNPIPSDNRDVDPIKLLTAALSMTETCDLSSPPNTIPNPQYNVNNTDNTLTFSSMSTSSTQQYYGQNSQEFQYNSHDCSYQHNSIIQNNNHINKPQLVNRDKDLQMPDITEHNHISQNDDILNNHTSHYGTISHDHTMQHSHAMWVTDFETVT